MNEETQALADEITNVMREGVEVSLREGDGTAILLTIVAANVVTAALIGGAIYVGVALGKRFRRPQAVAEIVEVKKN